MTVKFRAKIDLRLLVLVLTFVTLSCQVAGSSPPSTAVWQHSVEPVVKLGIRNKEGGGVDRFTVVCVVRAPDDKL